MAPPTETKTETDVIFARLFGGCEGDQCVLEYRTKNSDKDPLQGSLLCEEGFSHAATHTCTHSAS